MDRVSTFRTRAALLSTLPGANGLIAFNGGLPTGNSFSLFTMQPDGTQVSKIIAPGPGRYVGDGLSWSPDGSRIAYSVCCYHHHVRLFTVNANGTGKSRMPARRKADSWTPTWSPDGTKIAFVRQSPSGDVALYSVNSDWTGLTRLTHQSLLATQEVADPSWSPSGTKIAFSGGQGQLAVIRANGTNLHDVVSMDSSSVAQPSWSPDGAQIVFVAESYTFGKKADIWSVGVNGSGLTRLTRSKKRLEYSPRVSPDGSLIAFVRGKSIFGNFDVWMMDTNGANLMRVAATPRSESSIDWATG
jgi:Tol biopolymer transport system component